MANTSNANYSSLLKTIWCAKELQDEALRNHPLLGMVSKSTDFTGDGMKVPLLIGDQQGFASNFQSAQGNITPTSQRAFFVQRVNQYTLGRIDGETIETAVANKGAFLNVMTDQVKRAKNRAMQGIATGLYGDVNGSIGTTSAVTSTTFDVPLTESYNFSLQMNIQAYDPAGPTLRNGSGLVTGIDRTFSATTGRITYSGTIGSPGSPFTPGDKVCVDGTFGQSMSGLKAYIPDTNAEASTTLWGVNRADDVQRLAGLRLTTSAPIEEALQSALSVQYLAGGKPNKGFMSPIDFGNFVNSLGSKVQRDAGDKAKTGYDSIDIYSAAGTVKIYSDPDCPKGKVYLLQMDTWTLASAGEAPHILDYGDGQSLRVGNQDAQEFRIGARLNLICSAPGFNQVVLLNP